MQKHQFLWKLVVPAFFLFSIILPSPGIAQLQPNELFDISLEELLNLEISTSSKTEQKAWEASASVLVITNEIILTRGYQDLLDILKSIPYFQIQSEHGHWTKGAIVNLRGHRSGDSGNNKFLLLIDGIKLSDDAEEGLYLGLNSIPLTSVRQIEIVYGPNSTLYGRDAYAGMINLITYNQNNHLSGFSYGTYNSRRIYSGITHKFKKNVSGNIYFTNYKSAEQDPTEKSITYLNRHVFPAHPYTGRFYRSSNNTMFNIGLKLYGISLKYLLYDIVGSETYGCNPNFYVTEYSTLTAQKNQILSAEFKHKFSPKLTVSGYSAYKKYEFQPQTANLYTADLSRGVIDSTGTIDPFYAYGGRKFYYFRTNAYKIETKSIYQITPSLKNIFGINFQYVKGIPVISNGKGEKPIATEKQREPLEHSFTTNGIFSVFIYQAGKSLLFSAGGRFDINSNYKNMFTPRLAAIAHFNHDIFKFIVSGGYLAPSITQAYFESLTSFSWIKTNPNLKPEKNVSHELAWTHLSKKSQIDINIFHNNLSNSILESVTTGDSAYIFVGGDSLFVPVLQSQNISRGYRYGFCINVTTHLNKYLKIYANYSYINGKDRMRGNVLKLIDNLTSNHTLNAGVLGKYKKYSFYSGIHWYSKRRIQSNHIGSAYEILLDDKGFLNFDPVLTVDLNLRANHLINGINAYLTVKNLLNREYYGQTLNAEWGSPKILQDLRRVTLGIEYEFK